MITEFFVMIGTSFMAWLGDLFGPWDPPEIFQQIAEVGNIVLMFGADMGAWVHWQVLAVCVSVAVATWLTVFTVKLIRAIAAHIPFFGGSGA